MSGLVKEAIVAITTPGASTADTNTTTGLVNYQRFTSTSGNRVWAKPAGVTTVYMEVIGGGGGGGGGRTGYADSGGGGGGGAFARGIYPAESLPSTLQINVGSKGDGGAVNNNGLPGNASKVTDTSPSPDKIILQAFGGGGGKDGGTGANDRGGGGGGGGTAAVGLIGGYNVGGAGGDPKIQGDSAGHSFSGRGGAGTGAHQHGFSSEFGGGGGIRRTGR